MIGSLSLDQLRVLVTIADTGGFSAAGRRLGRAQSAISQAVATLEAIPGVTLFDRSGHRPRLTDVGRVLVDQARLVLAGAARFEAVAAGTREGLEPDLALAIDPLVPTAPLIDRLRALSDTCPTCRSASPPRGWAARLGGYAAVRRRSASACCCRTCLTTSQSIRCCASSCGPWWRSAIPWRRLAARRCAETLSRTCSWCSRRGSCTVPYARPPTLPASASASAAAQLRDAPARAGVDIRVIQVLLGHSKLETTALYTKVATRTIRAVTGPLDRLMALMEGKTPAG